MVFSAHLDEETKLRLHPVFTTTLACCTRNVHSLSGTRWDSRELFFFIVSFLRFGCRFFFGGGRTTRKHRICSCLRRAMIGMGSVLLGACSYLTTDDSPPSSSRHCQHQGSPWKRHVSPFRSRRVPSCHRGRPGSVVRYKIDEVGFPISPGP